MGAVVIWLRSLRRHLQGVGVYVVRSITTVLMIVRCDRRAFAIQQARSFSLQRISRQEVRCKGGERGTPLDYAINWVRLHVAMMSLEHAALKTGNALTIRCSWRRCRDDPRPENNGKGQDLCHTGNGRHATKPWRTPNGIASARSVGRLASGPTLTLVSRV